ncbi:MAG TPA: hypothetical protein VF762_02365 [Blastocatellia bacterium]
MAKRQEPPAAERSQAEEKPKPRSIRWVGEGEPHKSVQIGMLNLELPDADAQRKGFETEHARLLVTNVRGYKFLITMLLFMLALPASLPFARALAQTAAPPELPRVYLDTRYVLPTGRVWLVGAGTNLQTTINSVQPGDLIKVAAGVAKTGNFTLPAKSGLGAIFIQTGDLAGIPAEGTRVGPANASSMAKILSPNTQPAIATLGAAANYRFIGIEIGLAPGVLTNYGLVEFGRGNETSEAALPGNLVLDRCYLHGNPTGDCSRAVALNSKTSAVVDCYISNIHGVGFDTQAIASWNSPGPLKIVNNYLEAAGENFLAGGADPKIPGLVVSDIEFRRNTCSKPWRWRPTDPSYAGAHYTVKNLFELKNAQRVLADGNVFENNWTDAQNGTAILFTPRNQDGTAPWSVVQDITFTNNIVRFSGSAINILGSDNERSSQRTMRIKIENDLIYGIGQPDADGAFMFLLRGPADVTVKRNTVIQTGNIITMDSLPKSANLTYAGNITAPGSYGMSGTELSEGIASLNGFVSVYDVSGNVLTGRPSYLYPPGNFFPAALTDIGFIDPANNNYQLSQANAYQGKGVDFAALNAAVAGTVIPPPAPTSFTTLQMPAAGIDVEYKDPATGRVLHTVKVRPQ